MTYYARSASAQRLTFQTLSNKRERKARSNAKLAHEHLVELSRIFEIIQGHAKPEDKRDWMN